MCCLLVLLVLWEMGGALFGVDKRTCRHWIQYPGIGIEDRRLKMHGKVSGASSIFDPGRYWIQYAGIGSNTGQDRRLKIEDA